MLFYSKLYSSVSVLQADGGGGGSKPAPSADCIHIDVETYDGIVDNIETTNNATITTESGYIEPDGDCLKNQVIPYYQTADHEVEDFLRLMKKETQLVVDTMRKMRDNYVEVDKTKDDELKNSGTPKTGGGGGGGTSYMQDR